MRCALENAYVNEWRTRKHKKCPLAQLEEKIVFGIMACVAAAHGLVAISIFTLCLLLVVMSLCVKFCAVFCVVFRAAALFDMFRGAVKARAAHPLTH